jgi:hypothetical protein
MVDPEVAIARTLQILIDVPLRIDDRRDAAGLVRDEIRGVREALQVELLENQGRLRIGAILTRTERNGGAGLHTENGRG